jgi:hypothetical protein
LTRIPCAAAPPETENNDETPVHAGIARYALDLGEHGRVLVENVGIRRGAPVAGPDDRPYFRGMLRFTAPQGPLHWLNESVFVTSGHREGGTVHMDVWEMQ